MVFFFEIGEVIMTVADLVGYFDRLRVQALALEQDEIAKGRTGFYPAGAAHAYDIVVKKLRQLPGTTVLDP